MDKKKIGIGLAVLIILAFLAFHFFSVWSVYSNALETLPTYESNLNKSIPILVTQSILENKEVEMVLSSTPEEIITSKYLKAKLNSKTILEEYEKLPAYYFSKAISSISNQVEIGIDCGPFEELGSANLACALNKEKLKVNIDCSKYGFDEITQKDNYLCNIILSNTDEKPKEFIKPISLEENWRSLMDELILKSKKSKQNLEKISFITALLDKDKYLKTYTAVRATSFLSGASLMHILSNAEEIEAMNSGKIKYFSSGNTSIESELGDCLEKRIQPEEISTEKIIIIRGFKFADSIIADYEQEYTKMVQESKTDKIKALYRCVGLSAHNSFFEYDWESDCVTKRNELTYKTINMLNWSKDINANFAVLDDVIFCEGNKQLDLDRIKEETGIEITSENVEVSEDLPNSNKFQNSFDGNTLTIEYSGSYNVSVGLALIKEEGQYKLLLRSN